MRLSDTSSYNLKLEFAKGFWFFIVVWDFVGFIEMCFLGSAGMVDECFVEYCAKRRRFALVLIPNVFVAAERIV